MGSIMINYYCVCEYDGTEYFGWAIQNNKVTIQGIIEKILLKTFKQKIRIYGSGRTDAKVHAIYQVFNFKLLGKEIEPNKVKEILNNTLPTDIRVKNVKIVSDKFHATHDVKDKTYRYVINNDPESIFGAARYAHYVWTIKEKIDVKLLKNALKNFIGIHNFLSFSTSILKNTTRTINWIKVAQRKSLIIIEINGDGFLRSMIRMIVAYCVDIVVNNKTTNSINYLLTHPKKGSSILVAPGHGLTLIKVNY